MGRRPLRREKAKPPGWQTLRSHAVVFARTQPGKRREGRFEERHFGSMLGGGSCPRGQKAQESMSFRPGLNLRGRQGRRLTPWAQAAEASVSSSLSLIGKRQSGTFIGNNEWIMELEKSSEERSPRALGAERGCQGLKGQRHREGSQTLRMGLSTWLALHVERFFGSEKKGSSFWIC
jgi:hypothetical protein